jgi:transcriptional regulator NrdR family protein
MDDETGGKEGGGGDNPFSFKSFVKRASTDGGVKAVMKEGAGRGKKTRSAAALPFPEEGEGNPFSFKQFVKKQTLSSDRSSSSDEDHSFSTSLDTTHDLLSPDHPLPLPLTKAVPTTTAGSSGRNEKPRTISSSSRKTTQPLPNATTGKDNLKSTRKQKKQKDKLFDDTDSDSDIFTSTCGDLTLPPPANVSQTVVTSDPLDVFDTSDSNMRGEAERVSVLRLSDSSDDSVVMTDRQGSVLPGVIQSSEPESLHLRQQCSQLTAENKQLKSELENFKEKYRKEKLKNSKLGEQLQALRKKEAEETKALEDMVAKVEENLVASTKRAMSSEATVSRLKQEMQSLQTQLSQADAQSVHRHYEELLSGVRDKATFASRQLSMASMAADQSIRELLSGVDTLKNVAEVLQFIDRISEVKQH